MSGFSFENQIKSINLFSMSGYSFFLQEELKGKKFSLVFNEISVNSNFWDKRSETFKRNSGFAIALKELG